MYHTHTYIYTYEYMGISWNGRPPKPPASILNLSNAYFRWLMDTFAAGNLCIYSLIFLYLYMIWICFHATNHNKMCIYTVLHVHIFCATCKIFAGLPRHGLWQWLSLKLFFFVLPCPIETNCHVLSYDIIWPYLVFAERSISSRSLPFSLICLAFNIDLI